MTKLKYNDLQTFENKKARLTFTRNFDHVDGNWPGSIYLIGKYGSISSISDACLNFVHQNTGKNTFVSELSPHLSISKPFVLRHHQIESFINEFNDSLTTHIRFNVQVYSEIQLLLNESRNRLFVTLPVEDCESQILKLVSIANTLLAKFRQPTYYENPLFHISIASVPFVEQLNGTSFVPTPTVSSVYQIASKQSPAKRIIRYCNAKSPYSDSSSSSSSDSASESDCEENEECCDIVSNLLTTQQQVESLLSLVNNNNATKQTVDAEEEYGIECLGSVLTFNGVECRIGNRVFRYYFHQQNASKSKTAHSKFVEIK